MFVALLTTVAFGTRTQLLDALAELARGLKIDERGSSDWEERDLTHSDRYINGKYYGLTSTKAEVDWKTQFEYVIGPAGQVCSDGGYAEITNSGVCKSAIGQLGLYERGGYEDNWDAVTPGCSFRDSDGKRHFNRRGKGQGKSRGDLRPVCIKKRNCEGLTDTMEDKDNWSGPVICWTYSRKCYTKSFSWQNLAYVMDEIAQKCQRNCCEEYNFNAEDGGSWYDCKNGIHKEDNGISFGDNYSIVGITRYNNVCQRWGSDELDVHNPNDVNNGYQFQGGGGGAYGWRRSQK